MKIKMHRDSLAEAMKTVAQIEPTADAIRGYLKAQGLDEPDDKQLQVSVTRYGHDARIGWDTYLVTVEGYGVLAMTDGPI